jgi:hypothetical protein
LSYLLNSPVASTAIRKIVGRARDNARKAAKTQAAQTQAAQIPVTPELPKFDKEDIVNFIKQYYTNKATKQTYLVGYDNSRHKDKATSNFPDFNSDDLLDPAFLEKYKSHKNLKLIISPISKYLTEKKLIEFEEFKKLKTTIQDYLRKISDAYVLKTVIKTTTDQNTVTLSELHDIFEDSFNALYNEKILPYKVTKTQLYNQTILSGFYSMVNGFRDDIGSGLLKKPTDNVESQNYMDGNTYVLNKYKTSEKHGQLIFDIPVKLMKVINDSQSEFPRNYVLLMVSDSSQRGDKILTRSLHKALKRDVTINEIRRSWVSEVFEKTPEQSIELSRKMGHSFSIARMIYSRLSKK